MDEGNNNTSVNQSRLETPNWGVLLALLIGGFLILLNPAVVIISVFNELNIQFGGPTFSHFITIIGFEVISIALIYYFVRARGNTLKAIRMKIPKIKDLFQGAFAFLPYFAVTVGAMVLLRALFPEVNFDQEQQIGFESARSTFDLVLVYIALAVVVPVSEEMLFRGVLLQGFLKRFSPLIAIFATSALFGLAHFQLNVSIDTFIFGLFLGTVVIMTKNLWPAILLHSIKNSLAFGAIFLFS